LSSFAVIVNPSGRPWSGFQRKLFEEFASQCTVGIYLAIPPEQAAQADFRLPASAIATQVQRFSKFAEKSAAAYLTVRHIPARIQLWENFRPD
jgi:hypothetical protein